MKFKESYSLLKSELEPHFDQNEIGSIARILYEDLFSKLGPHFSQEEMSAEQIDVFHDAKTRLIAGEPIDYITGIREFYGLRFRVDSAVLIPRQETEELVTWILEDLGSHSDKKIVDIGTGSGCIPITIDKKTNSVNDVIGIDISNVALATARVNNVSLKTNVRFNQSDVLQDSLDSYQNLDVIVSNPPYILTAERSLMNRQVLDHEPDIALFTDGDDPLVFYKRINQIALQNLKKGGLLYYEISALHRDAMMELMERDGFVDVESRKDISGNWRMIKARKY